jgi:hypothetical protein
MNSRCKVQEMAKSESQPCRRFKHMNITPAFLKHLPKCSACKAVIAHLNRESEMLVWVLKHRN